MTQSNLLELAQQGDPQAIAALMNQSLQPRGMTATVERAGDSLSVLLEADQVPNRQTLTAFVYRGISNLGVGSIRSVKVLGQQTGTNLPVWTQDLTLEVTTTVADAIGAVDLSPVVDSRADLSPTDDALNGYLSDTDSYPEPSSELDELDLSFEDSSQDLSQDLFQDSSGSAADSSDEDALWISSPEEDSQNSLADLLAEEPNDLEGLFDEPPGQFEAGATSGENPLEDLRSMFGEQSEADFPPLEESSFNGTNGASLNGTAQADNLEALFGEDLEEGSPVEFLGTFGESAPGSSLDFGDGALDGDRIEDPSDDLLGDLSSLNGSLDSELDLGSGNSDSLENLDDSLDGLFGDQPAPESELSMAELGMFEETPPDQEEFQDLFAESAPASSSESVLDDLLGQPASEMSAPESWSLMDDEPAAPVEPVDDSDDQLMSFLDETSDEELSLEGDRSTSEESVDFADDSADTDQFMSFLSEESSPDLSVLEVSALEEPGLEDETPAGENALNELTGEDSLLGFLDEESEPSEPSSEPSMDLADNLFPEATETYEPVSFEEPVSFGETVSIAVPQPINFQQQQALDDFFADDPLADFLEQPVQTPEEDFQEGGFSEPMAAATAQNYFSSEPVIDFQTEELNSVPQFQPEEPDFLSETFQPDSEPTDLYSERMGSLEAIDTWDGALDNPLPDVEVNQADAISSLESLTDDSDLPDLRTEAMFRDTAFDRQPEAEPDALHESPRWDLDEDEAPLDNLALPALGAMGAGAMGVGAMGAGGIEDLTVSLPNLPDDGYSQVAYPSLSDPMQAAPQPKGSPWLFPLVLFGLTGWVLALVGFSYWLRERDGTPPPIVQPSAGSPVPSVPPAPANPPAAPSSALPGSEDEAAAANGAKDSAAALDELAEKPSWLDVD